MRISSQVLPLPRSKRVRQFEGKRKETIVWAEKWQGEGRGSGSVCDMDISVCEEKGAASLGCQCALLILATCFDYFSRLTKM